MSDKFKIGDHVSRNSEAGRVSGRIIKVHTKDFDYSLVQCRMILKGGGDSNVK